MILEPLVRGLDISDPPTAKQDPGPPSPPINGCRSTSSTTISKVTAMELAKASPPWGGQSSRAKPLINKRLNPRLTTIAPIPTPTGVLVFFKA